MHTRMLVRVALALALVLTTGACVDDPGPTNPAVDITADGAHAGGTVPVRMMSRNMYLGGNIDHVLFDPVNGPDIAWNEIQTTNFPARAPHLAAEILERMPHLVGLQEVTRFVLRDPGTFAPLVTIDWLDILMAYLGPAGYVVVERGEHFHTFLPMGGFIVEYLDGDGIIALASEVTINESGKAFFQAQVNLDDFAPPDLGLNLGLNLRGFQWADVTVAGSRFLFVNTHLEVQHWRPIQEAQAAELVAWVNTKHMPTFMVGDFNSAANPNAPERAKTDSYRMILDAGFDDLWLRGRGRFTNVGPTCCQASDLLNPTSELDERLDILFARNTPSRKGYAGGASLSIFGYEPTSRFLVTGDHPPYYLWPADHAGLFGELWLPRGLMR